MDEKKHAGGNLRYIRGRIVMRVLYEAGLNGPAAEVDVIIFCLSVMPAGASGAAPGLSRPTPRGCSLRRPPESVRHGMKSGRMVL
jgi:hypothetical protein